MGIRRLTDKLHDIAHKDKPMPSPNQATSDLERQLKVMGEGTYPRATKLQDDSILGVHTSFHNGTNIITATRSLDNGMTWSPVGEVTRGVGDIDNPFVVQLPSGKILCAFRNHSRDSSGAYTFYRITICSSIDGGVSWRYLSTAEEVSRQNHPLIVLN